MQHGKNIYFVSVKFDDQAKWEQQSHEENKPIFLDLLAESTVLPAAFHSRNNDFCGR